MYIFCIKIQTTKQLQNIIKNVLYFGYIYSAVFIYRIVYFYIKYDPRNSVFYERLIIWLIDEPSMYASHVNIYTKNDLYKMGLYISMTMHYNKIYFIFVRRVLYWKTEMS